jgi:signal transduction histidine kinase
LIESQENERKRVARELHDDVVNDLASLALSVHNVSGKLPETAGNLRQGMMGIHDRAVTLTEKVRNISHSLHPASLQHLGLLPAIRSVCNEFKVKEKAAVELFLDDSLVSVSLEADICLFRIVQEALRNVAKHARANNVLVSLRRFDDRVELIISDDGVGFDPEIARSSGGLGLASMRERLEGLGGDLKIISAVGRGVEIIAHIPFLAPK